MKAPEPSISVITICHNNLADLQATCAMLDAQTEPPLEHIIVNGSTEGDIARWLATTHQPPWRIAINEPDNGISDAFNKGIMRSSGAIIHLHNAGDTYADNRVLAQVREIFRVHGHLKWLHGQYQQHRGGKWMVAGKPFSRKLLYRGMRQIGHPTMFVRASLYRQYGLFRQDKVVAMDYDFLARIADEPFRYIARPLVRFAPGGVSSKRVWRGLSEVIESHKRLHGKGGKARLWAWRTWLLHHATNTGPGGYFFRRRHSGAAE